MTRRVRVRPDRLAEPAQHCAILGCDRRPLPGELTCDRHTKPRDDAG